MAVSGYSPASNAVIEDVRSDVGGKLLRLGDQNRHAASDLRPRVRGKFLFVGDEKLYVRGVTYGAFRPDADGHEYYDLDVIERDFAHMAAVGLNAVRIPHTMPPRSLLDVAQRHGLCVMVGLSAESYIGFLNDKRDTSDIERSIRAKVRTCAGHPALLCYALGNEIPAPVARWFGRHRVERYLERVYHAIKSEDPDGLVTYVNYPSTEYLQLPFLDLICFNVYLESQDRFEAYIARLQNIAGDRPLMMSEIGLDSLRNGREAQARSLAWQIRSTFAAGCAGAFVFAWTDEWHRAGAEVEDWEFGLTDRERGPKPALEAVREAFADAPFPSNGPWPHISVIVCSRNGARTIGECCEGLARLAYPNFEVIIVNDGSTDETPRIAREYGFRVIDTAHRGLSHARNAGLAAAGGDIVAYLDDDAYPDPHWLHYLAATFLTSNHVGVGGPNIPPSGDGPVAACVANAPGGPVHVLLSDREAEHLPGCNMAFRKQALEAIGGFDPRYRVAGDDVDVCWRLQQCGWTLGFSPAAMVWHHRRNSVRAYWNQQRDYGQAEALLEQKWPEKYNGLGRLTWSGRMYGGRSTKADRCAIGGRIYQGLWGCAPFQSLYHPGAGTLHSLPLMPEWYLVIVFLAALSALGGLWSPLVLAVPLLILAVVATLIQAGLSAAHARFTSAPRTRTERLKLQGLTAALHLLQPLARLWGKSRHGLTPWRRRGLSGLVFPRPRALAIWCDAWKPPETWLQAVVARLREGNACVLFGGAYDRWDLEVRSGTLGAALGQAWIACAALATAAALVVGRALWDSAIAASALHRTLTWLEEAQRDA